MMAGGGCCNCVFVGAPGTTCARPNATTETSPEVTAMASATSDQSQEPPNKRAKNAKAATIADHSATNARTRPRREAGERSRMGRRLTFELTGVRKRAKPAV